MAFSQRAKKALPFFVLIFGGALGLVQFSKVRYQYRSQKGVTPEDMEHLGIKMKKPGEISLEEEQKKLEEIDTDNWQNIRGPRPWEDNTEYNKSVQARIEEQRRKREGQQRQ